MENQLNSVLLIDDDYPTNLYNRIIIEKNGFARMVFDVNSGDRALNLLKESLAHLPDLILLDINMPIMNGWEFIEKLEEQNEEPLGKLKIFMLSASSNPDDIEKSKNYKNVHGFLSKPLDIQELKEKAKSL